LFYLYNRNDEKYKELPRWQRDLFWCFRLPGSETFIRIPKPFLYGSLFGSSVERLMEYFDTKDPKALDGLANTIISSATPVSVEDPLGGLLPTAIKPLIENISNWSFFRRRQVVSDSRKRLLPEEQYDRYTSETAKVIGKKIGYSPAKLENLLSGYFGGTGRYALEASDLIGRKYRQIQGMEVSKERPRELSDIPLVKGFVTRPAESSPESLSNFYEKADEIGKAYATYRRLKKEGREEDAKKILTRFPDLTKGKAVSKVSAQIRKISGKIDQIVESKTMDEETKRKNIRKLETYRMKLAQGVMKKL
jgi:hypothetical protein